MNAKRNLMVLLIAGLAMLVAACSGPGRVASTPVVVPDGQGTQAVEPLPSVTDSVEQVQTLMAGNLATQTAIAGGQSATATQPAVPTAMPVATQVPAEAQPTPVPPTPTPKPTHTPEPEPVADCSSPYTVQKGDWVWDIGRTCNIHPDWIISANGLVWPYIIYPGDLLILPANAPPFPGP